MSTSLEPPRWPGGPKICTIANLPAFETEVDFWKEHNRFSPGVHVDKVWQCDGCGHWHADTVARGPAGESSGSGRYSRHKMTAWDLLSEKERNHEKFKAAVIYAYEGQQFMADYLRRNGLSDIVLPPMGELSPERAASAQYVDDGDLFWRDKIIEVKRLSREHFFTGKHNWPFPGEFFVCAKHAYKERTLCHYIINHIMSHAGVVMSNTRSTWWTRRVPDSRYRDNYSCLNYCVDPEKVLWLNLQKNELHHPLYE